MPQLLEARVAPIPVVPRRKLRSLQAVLESTYTEIKLVLILNIIIFQKILNILCWPELVPHITGGDWPPGFDTVNMSVEHRLAELASPPSMG